MAFVRVMCKARKIEKLRRELEGEKKKSFDVSKGEKPQYSIKQKYRHFWVDLRNKLGKWFRKKCTFPEHTCIYRTVYKAKRDGTCENFTLKSIIGFISGFFLTYIFFMFFVFILNFKLSTATIMCSFFGSILTIGLAFSYKVRCVVFLLLPQFFSKRGRQALMAYAFILAITGPAKNTLHNMGILSESLACGQEQLKAAVRQIMDVIKKPFYAIRDAIKSVVKTVKVIVKKIKEVLLTIKRIIMAILRVIKAAFQFLGKILNICNKELGTPFERCTRAFENAITDCNAKLGPLFSWLCSITYLVQAVCYIVKIFDFICMVIDFISDSVIGVVVRKVKIFVRHIRTMFYVRIKFSHSFHFETNQSKSMSEITTGIVTEIRHRTENILTVFDFMSCATSLFFLFIILRVLNYRYKFLTSERFDNRFITKNFREIDMKRAQQEKETVLPLNHRERSLYITVTSIRLVKSEKLKLSKAAVVLGMTTLKLSTHMMADYALYWVLTVIRYHARFQSTVQAPNVVGLHIEGEGFIAKLLKSIVKAFQPLGVKLEIDTIPCLPDPIPPDYDRYIQIASLLILCWILTIFEPYGLRLRHSVMCYYHPTRARQRAVWLYNQIMRSRSSFLKFARRQLRRKITGAKGITKITFKEYLRANIKFKLFRLCLGSDRQDACLLCGEVFRETDPVKPIHCIKPGCPGIYCEQCYADLQNLCTVCMEPIQYGDISDISEEKDSSGDEAPLPEKKKKKIKKKCTISKCLKAKDDENSDDEEGGLLHDDQDDSEKSDSDYSSGSSTDNSYSYQNKKDLTSEPNARSSQKFSDVEKQGIPDQATWYHFIKHGDWRIEPDSDDSITTQKIKDNKKKDVEQSSFSTSTSSSSSSLITELELKKRSAHISKFEKNSKEISSETIQPEDVTLKPQNAYSIPPQNLIDKDSNSSEDYKSSEESTNIFQLPYKNDSNSQNRLPYMGTGVDHQNKSSRNINKDQENISLTDFPFSSETTDENIPFKPSKPGISSVTETTFIETPEKSVSLISATSSSLDSEIEKFQKYSKHQHVQIPKLNLGSVSPVSSDSLICTSSPTVIDRFQKNVKYEIVRETSSTTTHSSRNNTSETSLASPKNPINMDYQIYVPRYDTFLDCTDLVTVGNSGCCRNESCLTKKISEYKHIQRQKRLEDIANRKKLLQESGQSTIEDSDIDEADNIHTKSISPPKKPSAYSLKVKDYYKKINRNEPTDNPAATKDQNKFIKFIRRIFRKAKADTELPISPKSKFLFGECDKRFIILSPKVKESISSTANDSSGIIHSTTTSGDELLNQHSTGTSTGSSSSSLMGSTASHMRGGAESKLENSEQSVTTSGTGTTTEATTSDTTTGIKQKDESVGNSDSEISEIDIYFGTSSKRRKKRNQANSKDSQSPTEDSQSPTEGFQSRTEGFQSRTEDFQSRTDTESRSAKSNSKIDRTHMNCNCPKNKPIASTDISTPRYSRQPAERDQDPLIQRMKQSPPASEAGDCGCDKSEMNKVMADPYTSSDISPTYVENIRGRCCSYPCRFPRNTENINENYYSSSSPNATTNKGMCMCYPSNEVNPGYIENVQGRYCTCPVQPQNMEMMQEHYTHPNQIPRPPPCCTKEPRERRPLAHSAQECCNKIRSTSEERRRRSSSVKYARSTEASAPEVREYTSPCRQPAAVYCKCPSRSPKINEIREQVLEYSAGEPTKTGSTIKGSFPPNPCSCRNIDGNQYPENRCACNTFEVSRADINQRMAVDDDEVSYCSGCSGRSKFPDLVYQNTDEFLDLVNELGDTLSNRNRERVKKTMREFEIKSSQNKNLDKPIIFESDSEGKSEANYNCQKPCSHCTGNQHPQYDQAPNTTFTRVETKRESLTSPPTHPPRYGYVETVVQHMDRNVDNEMETVPKYTKPGSNTHWELDTRTGEWYKVYNDYYDYGNEYYSVLPPSPPPFRQMCVCERHPRRYCTRNSPERQMGNYVPPPPRSGKCNNCTFSRDSPY